MPQASVGVLWGTRHLAQLPFLPAPARAGLASIFEGRWFELVLRGHVYQTRRLEDAGTVHAWAPTTTSAVLPDDILLTIGVKRCRMLDVTLDSGAGVGRACGALESQQVTAGIDMHDPCPVG